MNNEDFVSYEIAKRLYALDCDLNCEMAYFDRPWNHEHQLVSVVDACNQQCAYDGTDVYPAPTLAQAQKWLREKKDCIVVANPKNTRVGDDKDCCSNVWYSDIYIDEDIRRSNIGGNFNNTYESALSAGIEVALKLLNNKTEKS